MKELLGLVLCAQELVCMPHNKYRKAGKHICDYAFLNLLGLRDPPPKALSHCLCCNLRYFS